MSGHVNYPHEPGRLHDCPACEAACHCTPGAAECVFEGVHNAVVDDPACRDRGVHDPRTRHVAHECRVALGQAVPPRPASEEFRDEATAERRVTTTDGEDIHEAVQILFDIAHSSMDWGSGFLDTEEIEAVISLAVTMGWKPPIPPENSLPMVQLALRYPEHYDVYETRHAGGRVSYSIKERGQAHYGGWTKISADPS